MFRIKNRGVLNLHTPFDIFVPNNNIVAEHDGSHIVSFFDKNGKDNDQHGNTGRHKQSD